MLLFFRRERRIRLLAAVLMLFIAASLYAKGNGEKPAENAEFSDFFGDVQNRSSARLKFDISDPILISLFILCGLGLLLSIREIVKAVAESSMIRKDAAALVTGDLMPFEKKKRVKRVKKRMSGLRLKLTSFTIILVLSVNIMTSLPLYFLMMQSQRQTLIKGLWDRSHVLMESLTANSIKYLSRGELANMAYLPAQMAAVAEAMYVTITGYNPDTMVFEDGVWATNDPNILRKIDSNEFHPSYSRISDALSPFLKAYVADLNGQAKERLSGYPGNIANLKKELENLTVQYERNNDPEIAWHIDSVTLNINILESRIADTLFKISGGSKSEPEYPINNFDISQNHRFLLYKPIMYSYGSDDVFVWGFVRMEVSLNPIIQEIAAAQKAAMRMNLLVALAAQIVGAIGALILSTIIIRPISKLVKHVEMIRDTENKARLSGKTIELKSRDELAILGETINEMTDGLVKASLAASDLSIGKEIQKRFIPLELDSEGDKLSSGFEETKFVSIFGYYEGAAGVSGDYFDYQDLDGRYYAIIKCDIAGKGIPAAFIMIQVATMFLNYFKQWSPTEKNMHIEDLVYQINDFIENLAFKDRFAAFTLCLYDSYTGMARFCNAGDNVIHIFSAAEKRYKTITLPETPAAGVLSNIMVESISGYRVQTIEMQKGDILLLYTDGIEESKRRFRNSDFENIVCEDGMNHENHVAGQGSEEMGNDRVCNIINAVVNKQIYTLRKWHNPEGENRELQFDFRSSGGTVENVIMAMVSVEKMFRCYYNPEATEEDKVLVDTLVDSFLKKYFVQYRDYCSYTQEARDNKAHMYYTHLMEDAQSDDLAIMGIMRK